MKASLLVQRGLCLFENDHLLRKDMDESHCFAKLIANPVGKLKEALK